MNQNIPYVDKVVAALTYYGGEATLNDIYDYIQTHYGFILPEASEKSSIRKAIYHYSSDADLFKGDDDLFYAVDEKGKGLWGLRGFNPSGNQVSLTEDDEGFPEGKTKLRTHLYRERNPRVIREAKRRFKEKHGRLFCQACGFDFAKQYGEIGKDYIEAHHTLPVSQMQEGEMTKPEDIALLCSNCHKMVHRKRPWLMMEHLKELLES
jgi:putative restriction endonuclease